jgi:23S rRNA (cytosine1962-C5)-methyltransferase
MPELPTRAVPHPQMRTAFPILESWPDYELIDIGERRKLERFGTVIVDRPEPQALWRKSAPADIWAGAHMTFDAADEQETGAWKIHREPPRPWAVRFDKVTALCRTMTFRHVGVFPEQASHWRWVMQRIEAAGRPLSILNLFGYTGIVSLLAAGAGANVTHVDASKKAIGWARENQAASGLNDAPIRWICDDAVAFVDREIRRGRQYDAIILDPPAYGRGPDGEVWSLFDDVTRLVGQCGKLLSPNANFVLMSAYALRLSFFSVAELLADIDRPGAIEAGELMLKSTYGQRDFATSLFARWTPHE